MKKLMVALIVVARLAVPRAQAFFEGVLKAGQQTTITLSPAGTTGTAAAATVLAAKKSRLAVLGVLTAPALGTAQLVLPSLPKVSRLIIAVDLPPRGSIVLHVVQGTIDNQFQVSGDADFVYDVTP